MQNLWRFPERNECSTLIVALRGASPQGVNRSAWWMPWYPTFREMSQLEHVANERIAVVMPDQDFPLYPKERSKKAADQINRIISDEQPDRAFCFAFSKGASFFVETASKHCQFDGAVICSGVDPPMELDGTPRYGVDTLVLHETQEFWSPLNAGLVSTEATAKRVEGIFSQLGRCERRKYPGKHSWPAAWNQRILNWFGIT